MRVLRSSLYPNMSDRPLTTVVCDSDVIDTLESIALQAPHPGALVMHDIFTMPDGGIEQATVEAMKRFQAEENCEHNMSILFHWSLMHFPRINPGCTLMMDKPAPLRVEDIEYVLKQLKEEPSYQDFRIISISYDHQIVRLDKGEVNVQ